MTDLWGFLILLLVVLLILAVLWWWWRERRLPAAPPAEHRAHAIGAEPPVHEHPAAAPAVPAVPAVKAEGAVSGAAAVEEAVQSPPPPQPDNLEIVEGIGPKIARILNEAGILTFAQLAATDVARLEEILKAARLQFADPRTWPEQARLAAAGQMAELEKLQESLKGGRRA